MEMICENAGKCLESNCPEKKRHETDGRCVKECFICGGIKGSKCIPYVPASKPDIGTKEPIAPLTDHAKYCRLSKQAGGLCGRARNTLCTQDRDGGYYNTVSWEVCAIPSKQQPVELPKDPLEELIEEFCDEYRGYVCSNENGFNNFVRTFAEKVRAL